DQLQDAYRDGQTENLKQDHFEAGEEWENPGQCRTTFRSVLERRGVIEKCRVTSPFRFEFLSRQFSQSQRRICDPDKLRLDFIKDDPVITFPMNDCRQWDHREVAVGDVQGTW